MEHLDPELLKLILGACSTGSKAQTFPTLIQRVLALYDLQPPVGLRLFQEQFLTTDELKFFAAGLRRIGLTVSAELVGEMVSKKGTGFAERHPEDLYIELNNQIRRELKSIYLMVVPPENVRLLEELHPFGSIVAQRFGKEVADDARQASRCLALGAHTACVFHLMRIVEAGLNAIRQHLGLSEYAGSWDRIFKQIDARLKILSETKKDERARREIAFISDVRLHIAAIKDAWRNATVHEIAQTFDARQAARVYEAVRDLMERIAVELPEAPDGI